MISGLYKPGAAAANGTANESKKEKVETDPVARFYQQHMRRSDVPTYGKGPMNRYDHKASQNYREMIWKRQDELAAAKSRKRYEKDNKKDGDVTSIIMVILFMAIPLVSYKILSG